MITALVFFLLAAFICLTFTALLYMLFLATKTSLKEMLSEINTIADFFALKAKQYEKQETEIQRLKSNVEKIDQDLSDTQEKTQNTFEGLNERQDEARTQLTEFKSLMHQEWTKIHLHIDHAADITVKAVSNSITNLAQSLTSKLAAISAKTGKTEEYLEELKLSLQSVDDTLLKYNKSLSDTCTATLQNLEKIESVEKKLDSASEKTISRLNSMESKMREEILACRQKTEELSDKLDSLFKGMCEVQEALKSLPKNPPQTPAASESDDVKPDKNATESWNGMGPIPHPAPPKLNDLKKAMANEIPEGILIKADTEEDFIVSSESSIILPGGGHSTPKSSMAKKVVPFLDNTWRSNPKGH
ncbi:MAG: hypothetical protein HY602_00570 [Parcubacteria group bacterium]|nr:hypothetical protein [Parcubacteria group bacterium]